VLDYWIFASAFLASAIAPGADTILILTKAINNPRSAFIAAAGIATAKAVMVSIIFFGLLALIQDNPALLFILKILGVGYLSFRAFKLWFSEQMPTSKQNSSGEFLSGFAIGFANPQPFAFYLSILPLVIQTTDLTWLLAIVLIGFMLVASFYVAIAQRLSSWLSRKVNLKVLNRSIALVFLVLAVIVLTRN
jgi:threonine/homoserine/homoserine lactone efflux protein